MNLKQVYFRFYGNLNDFLPAERKQTTFPYRFQESGSIKDAIEALGVPHPEVALILVNGEAVDFSYLIQPENWISVYPCFTTLKLTSLVRLRPPLKNTHFILDIHLGKLANLLRLLGFDTLYRNDYLDEELAHISSQEERILLTRDRGLLKRSIVTYGYCIREAEPEKQILEVIKRFNLSPQILPFQRCLKCNGLIQPIDKKLISDRLALKTQQYYQEFSYCQNCDRIYWKGSHYEKMQQFLKKILTSNGFRSPF